MKKPIQLLAILPLSLFSILGSGGDQNLTNPALTPSEHLIAQKELSLDDRFGDRFVNNIFKDNILLNLAYMGDRISSPKNINWEEILKPFRFEFKLDPNKTFAFHEDVEDKYKDSLVKTTNAHFNYADGFKTDGYLFGDGVCHLASLINWVAKEAGLLVEAPTNHNFANIPDIPKEFGVSIYSSPGSRGSNELQNLYITNNKSRPITFKFEYNDNKLKVSVVELN